MHQLQSPEIQAFTAGYFNVLLHTAVTLVILFAGSLIYVLLTPHREIALIREGNAAAGVSLGGVVLGLAIPLAVSLTASASLIEIVIWGMATVFIQLLVFRGVDFVLHGLPQRIKDGEMAAAALLVGAKLGAALILAAAVAG